MRIFKLADTSPAVPHPQLLTCRSVSPVTLQAGLPSRLRRSLAPLRGAAEDLLKSLHRQHSQLSLLARNAPIPTDWAEGAPAEKLIPGFVLITVLW